MYLVLSAYCCLDGSSAILSLQVEGGGEAIRQSEPADQSSREPNLRMAMGGSPPDWLLSFLLSPEWRDLGSSGAVEGGS